MSKKKKKPLKIQEESLSLQAPTGSFMDAIKPEMINNLWKWDTLETVKF